MAESLASAAVENVTNQAMECASPYLRYFFCYGQIVQDFTNQRNALKLRKQRVDTHVDEAKRQIAVIYEDVEDWLKRAEKELEETQNLQDEIDRVKCFKWCPKWGWRYCLSKKLAEKTPIISDLLRTSNFAQVGRPGSLKGIEFITSTDFRDSKSSKSALNKITEAINDKGINMIGLYGMPGVGKTTLAKEVGRHAQKLFDKVVIFTMSQNPNIRTIQDKVAEMFGLKFQTNTEEGRAEELFRSMQGVNKILVIVDDLWEEFKLESIGIPFGDDPKGCKILLTTRHQQVCTKMNCQKEIQLGILSEVEAWVLFRDKAGLEDDCSILNEVAKEVAGECKGLPLAIVTVAKALKGESLDGWRAANQRFKDSRHLDNEEVLGDVLKPLKLSYDYLKKGNNQMTENNIQMCFLLCSLFPEDYDILIEELIVCGIGAGLFPYANSIEDKRNEIGIALKKLQKSGLLLESDDAERIRMHDVVRDFAHWLTSTGENRFMVKDKLKEWPDMVESFECYTAIALWNCSSNIKIFPDKVEFSKLKTLFLGGEWNDLLVVSSTFFEGMKALQALYLKCVRFSLKGFHSLPNFKTLGCFRCKLKNFSSLTNMKSLEILVLIETEIDEISEKLMNLSTLKYLRLYNVKVEEEEEEMKFPPKLVSRLTSLQELHVTNKNNINLLELNSLSRLTALSLYLSNNQFSQEDFVFPKLQRYNIVVGEFNISLEEMLTNRRLSIENFSSSLSAFKNLFCNVRKLELNNVSGLKNIVPSIGKKVLSELISLKLDSCDDMKFLIDITRDQESIVAFSNLVELNIDNMVSLKGLCYGLSPSHRAIARFTRLKVVTIEFCPELKTIFSTCLAQSMSCIEELYIESCDGLEQVIGFAQEEEIAKVEMPILPNHFNDSRLCCCPKLRILEIDNCKSLIYVCANTSTQGLQSLESVKISDCSQLMQIFKMEQNENGEDVVVPQVLLYLQFLRNIFCIISNCIIIIKFYSHLVDLFIKGCEEIERLILAKDQISSSSSSNAGLQPISFPNLSNITVINCGNLESLFSFGSVPILPKLECLKIKRNPKLEQLFKLKDEREVVAEVEMKFDKLGKLSLKELSSLIHFCPKGYHFVLSALEDLKVRDCPKLTTSFSIDSQEFVHCKTKTPQLLKEDAIEESVTVSNAIFNEDICWSRRGFSEMWFLLLLKTGALIIVLLTEKSIYLTPIDPKGIDLTFNCASRHKEPSHPEQDATFPPALLRMPFYPFTQQIAAQLGALNHRASNPFFIHCAAPPGKGGALKKAVSVNHWLFQTVEKDLSICGYRSSLSILSEIASRHLQSQQWPFHCTPLVFLLKELAHVSAAIWSSELDVGDQQYYPNQGKTKSFETNIELAFIVNVVKRYNEASSNKLAVVASSPVP
ncbi:hypothetical protein CXB51_010046 [Gossypium anomalum]|uniref:AAA+ ATPase domain-containing protein n=1 Tax=Gossypium anomalum TaxID=47600 RepID=A0A8J6CZ03_9ROSI|nr:hypothetical protein CXB51_010046 [Gossypium anomalum]